MFKLVNICLIAFAALLCCAYIEARATRAATPVSYLDDIELSYNPQTGLFRCDQLICSANTYSCRITRQANANWSFITRTNYCNDRAKIATETMQYDESNKFGAAQTIDIDITSFIGVSTELVYGYTNTSQLVNGTVRWEDWPNVQRQYREIIAEASQK